MRRLCAARAAQERNSREYWVSCCAHRMASIGVKAWRSSSASVSARSHGAGQCVDQPRQHALRRRSGRAARCASPPAPCSRPSRSRRPAAHRARARRSAPRPVQRPRARSVPAAARPAAPRATSGVRGSSATRPASGPSAAVCWRSSPLRACAEPSRSAQRCAPGHGPARPAWPAPAPAGRRGQAQVQLVEQPVAGLRFVAHQAGFDRGLQPLGVAEAAHRQGRRGQLHQLQQRRGVAARLVAWRVGHQCRGRGRGRVP